MWMYVWNMKLIITVWNRRQYICVYVIWITLWAQSPPPQGFYCCHSINSGLLTILVKKFISIMSCYGNTKLGFCCLRIRHISKTIWINLLFQTLIWGNVQQNVLQTPQHTDNDKSVASGDFILSTFNYLFTFQHLNT